jgi:hypothetical protein
MAAPKHAHSADGQGMALGNGEMLDRLYLAEFKCNASRGPDYPLRSGIQLELTTTNRRTYDAHVVRQPGVPISTYPMRHR